MIQSITLTDFRNHAFSRISIGGAKNIIITGANGSGKTAILEAVSMLGGDRGLRAATMPDIARFGASGGFSVFANLTDDTDVSVSYANGDTNRRAKVDGDNAPLSDLASILRIVWLSPKEDRLFLDSASDRRAFFDRLVSSFDAAHAGRVMRLSKLLSERGFALKTSRDAKWLDALDVQIAGISVSIAAARIKYASELNYFLKDCGVTVSGQIETLLLNGTAANAEKVYMEYLSQNRELTGDKMMIDGAHKSDFGVYNKSLKLPAYLTSTGQQKSVLVDLILAHAKLVRFQTGQTPLVLLDEAVAHLDDRARARVFDELAESDAQVWATGLDGEIFKDVRNAAFVTCHNGCINSILVS